ncbi:MAG: bifunctional metallophosphatase/5'-nucleotidase [Cyanobacteria bacterium HKST-UBA03]|nr:bifunctional metallophosphatase/5'-nucleotidase [Cyanobacteria bacterium HKST-UBA03]
MVSPLQFQPFLARPPAAYASPPPSSLQSPRSTTQTMPASRLRIVHNNDTHEHWPNMPKSVTAFNALASQGQQAGFDVLRLNSGDNNTFNEPDEWVLSILLNNLLHLDATTFGNHELDLNVNDLAQGLRNYAKYPSLVANLAISPNHPLAQLEQAGLLKPSVHLIRGQQGTYGLIGITRPSETAKISKSVKQSGVQSIPFSHTRQMVQAMVDDLERHGVNRIVLLSHMGYNLDRKLAQQVSGIDVIVGGDSHDAIQGIVPGQNLLTSPRGEPVLIVQAGWNGEYVGTADVGFDAAGRLLPLQSQLHPTSAFQDDVQADALLKQFLPPQQALAYMAQPVGVSSIKYRPNPLAQLLADSARNISGSDISFIRPSQVRKDIPVGTLTNWTLKEMMPYGGEFVTITASGSEIAGALARSAQGLGSVSGKKAELLHPAGLRLVIDVNKGQMRNIQVYNRQLQRWEPLDPNRQYTVTIDDYTVKQSDEFPEFAHPDRIMWQSHRSLRGIFMYALRQMGAPYQSIVIPPTDSRLQLV